MSSPESRFRDDIGPVVTTPEQIDAARRYIAGAARDAEDALLLMTALGIEP